MLKNVGIDVAVGAIPVVGDLFDVTWRANRRNLDLLRAHFHVEPPTEKGRPQRTRVLLIGTLGLLAAIGAFIWLVD